MPVRFVTEEQEDRAYRRIEQMARECVSLNSLKLSVVTLDSRASANTFSPNRLLQSLLPTASRLETLHIDAEQIRLQVGPAVLLGTDMHCFTELQHLSLDEICFCRHWVSGNGTNSLDPFELCDEGDEDKD